MGSVLTLKDLGQHHRTLLKKLIRQTGDENYGTLVSTHLEVGKDLRAVRKIIDEWCVVNGVE